MSDVTISIAGRSYTVACGAGEEAHIARLGRIIDRKLGEIPNLASQSEARALLFASLLLADDLHEAQTAAASAAAVAPAQEGRPTDAAAEALENVAQKLEGIASRLESGAATP